MFNLLRSSRRKKKANKNSTNSSRESPQASQQHVTAASTASSSSATPSPSPSLSATSYRAMARKRAAENAEYRSRLREQSVTATSATKASIEELEDLREIDAADIGVGKISEATVGGRACGRENVNLAKSNAAPTATATLSKSRNSAIGPAARGKVFAIGRKDVDGINKIVAATVSVAAAQPPTDSQTKSAEWQGHTYRNDTERDDRSGLSSTIRKKRKKIIDRFIKPNELEYSTTNRFSGTSSTTAATSAATTAATATAADPTRSNSAPKQFNNSRRINASTPQRTEDVPTTTTTTTNIESRKRNAVNSSEEQEQSVQQAEEEDDVVIYRHNPQLDNTSKAAEQAAPSASQAKKRQSRLSLNLGLGLVGKSKSSDESDPKAVKKEVGQTTLKLPFFRHSTKKAEKAEKAESSRDSEPNLLRRISQSVNEHKQRERGADDPLKRPNSELFYRETGAAAKATTNAGALQRGREFISDIFMARGRNFNRNKNPPQQQSHSKQPALYSGIESPSAQILHKATPAASHQQAASVGVLINHAANNNHRNNINNHNNSNSNVTAWPEHSTAHLETISELTSAAQKTKVTTATIAKAAESANAATATATATANTNTYQMTIPNNRTRNFSHSHIRSESSQANDEQTWQSRQTGQQAQHMPQRSNSAEHVSGAVRGEHVRARSEDPRAQAPPQELASKSGVRASSQSRLNGHDPSAQHFNSASNSKQQGVQNNIAANTPIEHNIKTSASVAGTSKTRAGNSATPPRESVAKCESENSLHSASVNDNISESVNSVGTTAMGQANGKTSTPPASRRASTPREFRESIIPTETSTLLDAIVLPTVLPTITVMDYGDVVGGGGSNAAADGAPTAGGPIEQEVFFDFENDEQPNSKKSKSVESVDSVLHISAADDEDDMDADADVDDEVFHAPTRSFEELQNKRSASPLRHNNHMRLEQVPEQEEEEQEGLEYSDANNNAEKQRQPEGPGTDAVAGNNTYECNLDNGLYSIRRQQQFSDDSPERSPLKSTNTSDSNLSTSFPDSGIGDSQTSSTSSMRQSPAKTAAPNGAGDNELLHSVKQHQQQQQQQQQEQQRQHSPHNRLPFVRDGNSTDCDDNSLLQYDDLVDYVDAESGVGTDASARLVCIESISLPDVVVESTTASSGSRSSNASPSFGSASSTGGEAIVNINGATGNSMGNVHFIPIHLEGDHSSNSSSSSQQKRRSVDDSIIGSNGLKSFAHMNGQQSKPTIEIIEEDGCETDFGCKWNNNNNNNHNHNNNNKRSDAAIEKLKHELIEQQSRLNVQLEDAQKNVHGLQAKIAEMQTKIQKLEEELSTKNWNVERLQSELNAAQKDDEYVRKHLKMLEHEKASLKQHYDDVEDEFKKRNDELESQYQELEEKYQTTHNQVHSLQTQLSAAQAEAEEWKNQMERIREDLEDQVRMLKAALENSEAERKINQDKWQREFEMLRTQNMDHEETLMRDCEWQVRHVQKQLKEKLDKSEHERYITLEKVEMLENAMLQRDREVEELKVYQVEVTSLRGVISEQENSIQTLMQQIQNLKADLRTANKNLEDQVDAVRKIKLKCDNAIYDKERQVTYRIDEVRNEAAAFWEDKLYTEMTRLKNELESVYVDDRREELDKLNMEHVEELRALTTRYTANEEELRAELAEVQEKFDRKNEDFLELRERSDNAILQTRLHLDRADREYQNAMCREDERREALEESLRKQFEAEKSDMEEKFRERLGHVKDEFSKELKISAQEMREEQQRELEKLRAKYQMEKDEALQELADRHRKKLAAVEDQMNDIELRHQHDLKDLKAAYDSEKAALDKRDISNANEIEQLHRKCRCLTNLFEEMRLRYERRDPRQEDLREIADLRSRCESQEQDLYLLTDRLRDMQLQMSDLQRNGDSSQPKKIAKPLKKPPPKTIPTNCDVIYEENEERETPSPVQQNSVDVEDSNEEAEKTNANQNEVEVQKLELHSKTNNINGALINDDDSQMITAV